MLRLFNQIGARFRAIPAQTRCFVTEAQKHFDEMDREKKIKIIELEISVSLINYCRTAFVNQFNMTC